MKLGVLYNTDRLNRDEFIEYARRVDDLGYESVWLPELFTRDPFSAAAFLLANTQQVMLATGIANIYARDAVATVSSASTLQEMSDGRFILGLGVSNARLNEARGHAWQNPVSRIREYLAAMEKVRLTSTQVDFPVHIAAHGPRMLDAAAELADGANTYLMPAEHAAEARARLGNKELNTMLFCLAEADPARARTIARKAIAYYVGLDYYHRAWRSFGFEAQDFEQGGSDRLIDAVVAWGDREQISARIRRQFDNGATRVVIIPIVAGGGGQPDWDLLGALCA